MQMAIVTGGSRGIGRATCLALARNGFSVVFTYQSRQDAALETLAAVQEIGGKALAVQAEAIDPAAIRLVADRALAEAGHIDVLVNNAGVFVTRSFLEISLEEWRTVLDTNLTGAFHACQAVLPSMVKQGGGSIINVSSFVAERGSARHAHYAASKAGLVALTKSLAREYGRSGIRVNAVAPGRIDTEMLAEELSTERGRFLREAPLGRLGSVEEVAAAIAFLASDAASYITGHTIQVNGGALMS